MIKVALQGVKFFAYHGFYPEEQILGSHFVLDISVVFPQEHHFSDDEIAHTVNYEQLYQILHIEMSTPSKLLETVAQRMIDRAKVAYTFAETIQVGIKKLDPPLQGEVGCSFIEMTYTKPHDDLQ